MLHPRQHTIRNHTIPTKHVGIVYFMIAYTHIVEVFNTNGCLKHLYVWLLIHLYLKLENFKTISFVTKKTTNTS